MDQRNLLNNRKGTDRSEEEDCSDGMPPEDTCGTAEDTGLGKGKPSGRRRKGRPEGSARFDEVVDHPMEEIMSLPERARLLPGMMWYEVVEYIPGRTVCHRFPYMRYVLELLDEADKKAVFGDTVPREMRQGGDFMIDETLQTVGVDSKELVRRYLNRYLWEFYNKEKGLVEYIYEDGSRGQNVLKAFFNANPQTLEMLMSCDGYNTYRLFDTDEYPGVTVVGCWTHTRRNFIDALPSCHKPCEDMIAMIGSLFENEAVCGDLGFTGDDRLAYRKKRTKPVLDTIKATADRMWNDPWIMAVGLLKKAVGYLRNQWNHLSNILNSGVAEISNNLSEQRVKPIKLSLKNCLNIGSEEAAKKHTFMHSLAKSCRLCSVNIADYFTDLFRHARSTLSSDDLRGLLPNHYCAKC